MLTLLASAASTFGASDPFKNYNSDLISMLCIGEVVSEWMWDGEALYATGEPGTPVDGKYLIKEDGRNVFLIREGGHPGIEIIVDFEERRLTGVLFEARYIVKCH